MLNSLEKHDHESIPPTSSIEELSVINSNRKEPVMNKPHHAPPYQQAPPTSHQPHPPYTQPPISGSTYLPRPPQQLAQHSIYSSYTSDQLFGSSPYINSAQSSPIGIATANVALAHDAASKGDIMKLV